MCCWADAVERRAVLDHVEVDLEDAILRQRVLDVPRQEQLLELSRERLLSIEQHVLDHLHRDRRRAVLESVPLEIADQRALELAHDEAVMLVEAAVFGRRDRLDEVWRDLI